MTTVVRPSQSPEYQAIQAERHRKEVEHIVNRCFPDPNKVELYLRGCAEHRTKEQVDVLRTDTREAWRARLKTHTAH